MMTVHHISFEMVLTPNHSERDGEVAMTLKTGDVAADLHADTTDGRAPTGHNANP